MPLHPGGGGGGAIAVGGGDGGERGGDEGGDGGGGRGYQSSVRGWACRDRRKRRRQGRVVQVEPMEPVLKTPETQGPLLTYDRLLSRFAFILNLRRYTKAVASAGVSPVSTSAPATAGAIPTDYQVGRCRLQYQNPC